MCLQASEGCDHTFLKKCVLYIHTHFFTAYNVCDPTFTGGITSTDVHSKTPHLG